MSAKQQLKSKSENSDRAHAIDCILPKAPQAAPVWLRSLPFAAFFLVLVAHALYIRHAAAAPISGFADSGITQAVGFWSSFGPYIQAQDYFLGFSYATGSAFAVWAAAQFVRTRQAALAAGAAGSVTLVGILMAAGCFFLGCCGSPMLGVYLALFGAKFFGAGKPLMATVTLMSVTCGWWILSRRVANSGNVSGCCDD